MKKALVPIVSFLLVMTCADLLLNAFHSPLWFCILVAVGMSVLYATMTMRD